MQGNQMIPVNQTTGLRSSEVGRTPAPIKPVNRDAEFMHQIPGLINTIANGDPAAAIEWKNSVRLRRMRGESWESVYRLLAQVAYPSI
jgi:hypothetical protein